MHSSIINVEQLPICLEDIRMLRIPFCQKPGSESSESVVGDPREAGGWSSKVRDTKPSKHLRMNQFKELGEA